MGGFLTMTGKIIKDLATQKIAIQSLLRSEMVKVYYRYREDKRLPYYTKTAWYEDYEAYTKLGGNSFIKEFRDSLWTTKKVFGFPVCAIMDNANDGYFETHPSRFIVIIFQRI